MRVIDAKFLISLTMTAMVFYLLYVGYSGVEESKRKSERINALIERIDTEQQVSNQAHAYTREIQQNAAAERDQMLGNQERLLRQYARLEAQQRALLQWLRDNGIQVPVSLALPPQDAISPRTGGSASAPRKAPPETAGRSGRTPPGRTK